MKTFAVRLLASLTTAFAIGGLPSLVSATPISSVTDQVVNNGDGTWTYRYTVFNDSTPGPVRQWIVDWELPWFGDAGVPLSSIRVPDGRGNSIPPDPDGFLPWNYAIETIGVPNPDTGWEGVAAWQDPSDPFYSGPGSPFTTVTRVLHWYCDESDGACSEFGAQIRDGESLGGFGFVANYAPTAAPYQASWVFLPVRTGDPAFPLAGIPNSPAVNQQTPVPEPGVMMLLVSGLLVGLQRHTKKARSGGAAH